MPLFFILHLLTLFYSFLFFFFNDTPTPEIYTLSLHDALPISPRLAPTPAEPGVALSAAGICPLAQRAAAAVTENFIDYGVSHWVSPARRDGDRARACQRLVRSEWQHLCACGERRSDSLIGQLR